MALLLLVLPKPALVRRTHLPTRWPSGGQTGEVRCAHWHPILSPRPDVPLCWQMSPRTSASAAVRGIHASRLGGSTLCRLNQCRHEEEGRKKLPDLHGVSFLVSRSGGPEATALAAAAANASPTVTTGSFGSSRCLPKRRVC
jgi:hypothetical protein